ncbi:globin domain-containing protein [Actinocrinis puniceicyclus]|nr:globin domain-containing protein [Actinocrinis puniceicyclus]
MEKQDAYARFDASGEERDETAIATDAAQWSQEDLIAEIRESFALIEPYGAEAAAWFYEHFFAANPRYRKYFSSEAAAQHRRLFQAVQRIVGDLDRLDEFLPYLRRLAVRHRRFGLRTAHYQAFGVSLLAAVARYCGPQWTERTRAAWEAGYGLVATVMLEAAAEADASGPAYWEAEVTAHEKLVDGVVRVVVKPVADSRFSGQEHNGEYRYAAGQYASVETAALPRVWRDFSFATRPCGGEVEFHVQLTGTGGVSEVLVNQTAVGDRLRLAAAEGELAFPGPQHDCQLLAVAHGTGAAPVHALIQQAIAEGDRRPLTVVLASDDGPHYLAGALRELAAQHGQLTVEEVVGDPLAAVRAHGAATEAAGACGAVIVGPGALVDQCRGALLAAGVDPQAISSDLFD